MPAKWQTSARASLFFDMGNVFSNDGTQYVGEDLETPVTYKFSYHAAPAVRPVWRCNGWPRRWACSASATASRSTPYGGDTIHFPDRTEGFQFSVGQSF